MPVFFYTSAPPRGYPWVVVSPSWAPAWRPAAAIVDNGAFRFYMRGGFPRADVWLAAVKRAAWRLAQLGAAVTLVLPDYPLEPLRTLAAARMLADAARGPWRLGVVMHYVGAGDLRGVFESYVFDVEADVYMVPLKLPASAGAVARRIRVDEGYALRVAVEAVEAAEAAGARLHLLAPTRRLLAALADMGWPRAVESFDTTAWTRAPTATTKRAAGTISARSSGERQRFLCDYMEQLKRHGVPLRLWDGCARRDTPAPDPSM